MCAFIVYPERPKREGILEEVEAFIDEAAIKIVWFEDEGDTPSPLT